MVCKIDKPKKFNVLLLILFIIILGIILILVVSGRSLPTIETADEPPLGSIHTSAADPIPLPATVPTAQAFSPKTACVNQDYLNVHVWPGVGYPVLAEIVRGQEVHVIEESSDGQWSLLTQPVKGWVRTTCLRHTEKSDSPDLAPANPKTYRWVSARPRLRVRSLPNSDADITTHVAHGELVEIARFTEDLRWAYIIAPAEGWVSVWYLSETPPVE